MTRLETLEALTIAARDVGGPAEMAAFRTAMTPAVAARLIAVVMAEHRLRLHHRRFTDDEAPFRQARVVALDYFEQP